MDSMDDSLNFVETPLLLKELHRRFDSLIFVGAAIRTPTEDGVVMSVKGPHYACLGLTESLKTSLIYGGGDEDGTD
jgi:hypothetical protein